MNPPIPNAIEKLLSSGAWRSPGPNALRRIIGEHFDLPDMRLFEDRKTMRSIGKQVEAARYIEDPQFCMTRAASPGDARLVFQTALFIGGSVVPGDDVFLVVDLGPGLPAPRVLVFDWGRPCPERWVSVGSLEDFLDRLRMALPPLG